MQEKMINKRIRKILNISVLMTIYFFYIMVVFFIPRIEEEARKFIVIILLTVISFFDIREQKVPVTACVAILGIDVMHSVFVCLNLTSWVISIAMSVILLIIFTINRNLIGLGDILLIACVQPLLPENSLKFLFLTFAISSFTGLLKCFKTKNLKDISVPLSPCITVSFILLLVN